VKRHADAARHRATAALGGSERPLSRGDDGGFVERGASRLEDVDLRDVAVDVHRERQHDVSVLACGERGLRIDGVHVGQHGRRRDGRRRRRGRR
jgi:hypothetical protein